MRFYGRETELETLERIRSESKISSRFTVVTGRRPIGKTEKVEALRGCSVVCDCLSMEDI